MSFPTVVIVPAALQSPPFYEYLSTALKAKNIDSISISMPSVGASPSLPDFNEDVAVIRKIVFDLVEQGKDVILLMHSYGGIPGSQAVEGLGKDQRTKSGHKGGAIRLLYVAAWVLQEGERMPGAGDSKVLKEQAGDGYDEKAGTLVMSREAASAALFHDLPAEEAEKWPSQLKSHSVGALWSTQRYAGWKDIPSAYIIANDDRIVPPSLQESLIAKAQATQPKAFGKIYRLDCGHEAPLSRPEEVAEIVKQLAEVNVGNL